jgi:hypothetical protein
MRQLQMHYQNFQNMVRYQISDLTVVDVLVAEFRETIMHAIPKIIAFLSLTELNVRQAAAYALSKLSGQGNIILIC